jgi:hypothetical protein
MRRAHVVSAGFLLIAVAAWRSAPLGAGGQGAVSLSKPGHEDLTFWVNHNGLEQVDVEGELGFGDLARLLMRRRSNAERIRALRDRFVFTTREPSKLDTPDLLKPGNPPYVIAQGRTFNLLQVEGNTARAWRVQERMPGRVKRTVGGVEAEFDVRPLRQLKVTIVDEKGNPAAARVYLTGSDGLGYAPKGTISRFAPLPAEQFFHANGPFEIDLPSGVTTVEATRGIEYELTRLPVKLDNTASVTLRLKRWIDMPALGWYSSDAHIHANYTAEHHQVVTPRDVLDYTLGEDLHIPNMMVANSSGAFLHDKALFTGKLHPLSRPPYLLWWNEEMRNAGLYGHMCLYNLKQLVEPLYTGFRNTPQSEDYPPNYVQAKAARAQGGAVTYAHPGYAATFEGASARELPVDLALGETDAMDVLSNNPEEVAMELWYKLLNCGFRLGVSAGTDAFTNVADHYVPGAGRVYAHVTGGLTYEKWIAAYKGGRTFASNGPMVFLTVNSKMPGEEIALPAGQRKVRVKVDVRSKTLGDKVELLVNGEARPWSGEADLELERSAWIAARVTGPWNRLVLNDTSLFAHTSPVYVTVDGKPIRSQADARHWMEWIDKLIERVEQRGQFSSSARKQEVVDLFLKARRVYESRQ